MGMDVGSHREVAELSDTLFQAPVARYEEGFVINKYGTEERAQGKLSLRAAERMGFEASDGDEMVLRMLESGRSPEYYETYDAALVVEELTDNEREEIPAWGADPIMLEKIPDGFEYGKNYDFTVIHANTGQYIFSPSEIKMSEVQNDFQ
jgi:hypothetical protein